MSLVLLALCWGHLYTCNVLVETARRKLPALLVQACTLKSPGGVGTSAAGLYRDCSMHACHGTKPCEWYWPCLIALPGNVCSGHMMAQKSARQRRLTTLRGEDAGSPFCWQTAGFPSFSKDISIVIHTTRMKGENRPHVCVT